jgi:TolB-like protein/pimeloyl-ACP methyl ester carboxylesterase
LPEDRVKFLFADHILDTDRRELCCSGAPVPVEPQVFDLLTYLVQNRERVVSKDDLFASVWSGRIVADSTLASRISAARKAVGDSGEEQKLIRTVARKGIRFIGAVDCQPNGEKPVDTAGLLRNELREPPGPSLPPCDRPAIAVLPFVNMSGDPALEYFSDGISEDLITALSKLGWLFVIARNSSFTYKGKSVHMKQVAAELGVGYVIEGSVRKDGDRVRITVQLNDVATGSHLWAERYDRGLADEFAVQDEITDAIVAAIEPQLHGAENFRSGRKSPDSPGPCDLPMRAPDLPGTIALQTSALSQAPQLPHQSQDAEQLPARPALHDVQFCSTSDGVRIAYAKVGDGPPLVWAAHWLSHLSYSWETPIWSHWTEEFASDHAFVHYDERGNGLSDWDNPTFSVDAFVRDLEAVVDALGFDRFALIGSSKGGSTAMTYAARHPERVSHLILLGAFAQGWRVWGNADEIERREAIITLTRQGWAQDNPTFRQILTSRLLPDATVEEMGWFNDLQRMSTSAENAARLQQASGSFNVLDFLPGIAAPTLVLHCRDDAAIPFEQGRLIASRIPRTRLVALESRNHVLLPRDPAWAVFVGEVRRFLREEEPTLSRG